MVLVMLGRCRCLGVSARAASTARSCRASRCASCPAKSLRESAKRLDAYLPGVTSENHFKKLSCETDRRIYRWTCEGSSPSSSESNPSPDSPPYAAFRADLLEGLRDQAPAARRCTARRPPLVLLLYAIAFIFSCVCVASRIGKPNANG